MKSLPLFLLILLLLSLGGCSPAWKLRRAERLIKQAEAKGSFWSVDSVKVEIPVFVDRIALDTLFISRPSDTIQITKDRLRLKYVNLPGDTVWIEAVCDSLTIIKEVPVTVTKTIHAPKGKIKWWWLIIAGCVGGFVTLVLVAFRK
jgi:hypothetical protein